MSTEVSSEVLVTDSAQSRTATVKSKETEYTPEQLAAVGLRAGMFVKKRNNIGKDGGLVFDNRGAFRVIGQVERKGKENMLHAFTKAFLAARAKADINNSDKPMVK